MSKKEPRHAKTEDVVQQEQVEIKTEPNGLDNVEQKSDGQSQVLSSQDENTARLEAEVNRLTEELEKQKDQFMRKLADMDNYRKRLVREKETAVLFANEKLINDLIPILDDFDRAIDAAQTTTDVASYVEGIKLIQAQLLGMLDKNWGLKVMESTVGKEFSPHDHEACMMEQSEQYQYDTVLAELQKGYYLHDRVLRTAKVKVGKPL